MAGEAEAGVAVVIGKARSSASASFFMRVPQLTVPPVNREKVANLGGAADLACFVSCCFPLALASSRGSASSKASRSKASSAAISQNLLSRAPRRSRQLDSAYSRVRFAVRSCATRSKKAGADVDTEQAETCSHCDCHENDECSFHDIAPNVRAVVRSSRRSGRSGNGFPRWPDACGPVRR
jgi:hypothetical protein